MPPFAQSPFPNLFIAVSSANDPRSLVAAARRQLASLDKNDPIYHVATLDQYSAQSVMLLSCVGMYGVVSYIVLQRTHEIGIRMALGSQKGDVLRMIVGKGLLACYVPARRAANMDPMLALRNE